MNNDRIRQIVNVIALIAVVAVNFGSQAFRLNNTTNAEIANQYPILYFPANWAFSIWGMIYTLLFMWTVYQVLPAQAENPLHRKIGYLFVVTCLANIGWIFAFQFLNFPLSMIMMLVLLATLITLYLRLNIGLAAVSLRDKWLVHIPFSVYLGWITAATVTNAAYVLYDAGYTSAFLGIDAQTWTVLLLTVTGLLGVLMLVLRRDIAYAAVIIWAVAAIAARYQEITTVATASYLTIAVVGLTIILAIWWSVRSERPLQGKGA